MPAYLEPLGKGRPVLLDKPILFVGRHPECDIVLLNSRKVSRKHCCIALIENGFKVRDFGSTNGVSINGKLIRKEADFKRGDEITFGDVAYQLLKGKPPKNASKKSSVADDDDIMPDEDVQELIADAEGIPSEPDSIELSQEYPVVIHEDDPVSISQLPPARNSAVSDDSDYDEDSSAEIIILDESDPGLKDLESDID